MASISHDGGGYRRILFKLNGKRDKIHLGKTTAKAAETIRADIEAILEARELNRSMEPETATWLRGLGDEFYGKLATKGLAPSRGAHEQSTLATFIGKYLSVRTGDLKPGTIRNLNFSRSKLEEFFGSRKPLCDVTEGDADEFRLSLAKTLGGKHDPDHL